MNPQLPAPPDWGGEREPIPLSAVNQYLFCRRRAALIHLEGIFEDNEHTVLGELVHDHADFPGYEVAKGILVWRALPIWSDRLGLSGKCDIVEAEFHSASNLRCHIANLKSLKPVEYKKGKRRRFSNDDAQLCAQALCLEEMFGIPVERGAIFHAESKRRREVEFTPELRAMTEQAIADLHALLGESKIPGSIPQLPKPLYRPACEECSLFEICMPKATENDEATSRLAERLYET
ncbi:MAG: CRISPR-associated protein Cas4 [Verrucomicrobiia bacterium]